MSSEANVVWLDLDVLDDRPIVFHTHGIRRQRGRVDRTLDLFVNLEVLERAPVGGRVFFLVTLSPLLLRRVVRAVLRFLIVVILILTGGFGLFLLFQFLPQPFRSLREP